MRQVSKSCLSNPSQKRDFENVRCGFSSQNAQVGFAKWVRAAWASGWCRNYYHTADTRPISPVNGKRIRLTTWNLEVLNCQLGSGYRSDQRMHPSCLNNKNSECTARMTEIKQIWVVTQQINWMNVNWVGLRAFHNDDVQSCTCYIPTTSFLDLLSLYQTHSSALGLTLYISSRCPVPCRVVRIQTNRRIINTSSSNSRDVIQERKRHFGHYPWPGKTPSTFRHWLGLQVEKNCRLYWNEPPRHYSFPYCLFTPLQPIFVLLGRKWRGGVWNSWFTCTAPCWEKLGWCYGGQSRHWNLLHRQRHKGSEGCHQKGSANYSFHHPGSLNDWIWNQLGKKQTCLLLRSHLFVVVLAALK